MPTRRRRGGPQGLLLLIFLTFAAVPVAAQDIAVDRETGSVTISAGGQIRNFEPRFAVFFTERSPQPALRYAEIPRVPNYNVLTWGRDAELKVDPERHVQDGFDPQVDREYGPGRTASVFAAGPFVETTATRTILHDQGADWEFPPHDWFEFSASLRWSDDAERVARLSWKLTPRKRGFYSVGYLGAPAVARENVRQLWQPMIWNDRRFPTESFLTPAFLCPLPGTMVNDGAVTVCVMAESAELPFLPMPTRDANNPFGVALRDRDGAARPMIFAPILGGQGSQAVPGDAFSFSCLLTASGEPVDRLYETLARQEFQFRDLRRNHLCSLNETLENMIAYGLGEWSRFDADLRGSEYSTDVPGSVKNVSPVPLLGAALVTDNRRIYHERALPVTEAVCSREKLLFVVSPDVKGQSPSWLLRGPASTIPDLAAAAAMFQHRSGALETLAFQDFGKDKVYNLDEPTPGDRWQNSLALYRLTGERRLLDDAVQQARKEIAARQTALPDEHREGSFFWPTFTPPWIDYLELYEETQDGEILAAAHDGARQYLQFCWLCPSVPSGVVRVDESGLAPRYRGGDRYDDIRVEPSEVPAWLVSEIGLTPESAGTCKGHRAILNAHYAPFMARIGWLTDDAFLSEVARWAIIGRYRNFPGYHMNTARTAVYMDENFPLRPQSQLNGTTSIHYNHIWSHIGLLIDSLVSAATTRSAGEVQFPSRYSEGYAYLQSKVYGDRPGTFYGHSGVWLWMPERLLTFSSPEINYVAARKDDSLFLLLMNESGESLSDRIELHSGKVVVAEDGPAPIVKQLSPGGGAVAMSGRTLHVDLPPRGILAFELRGVDLQTDLQDDYQNGGQGHWPGPVQLEFGGTTGMVFDFGRGLASAYVYVKATDRVLSEVTLEYTIDGVSGSQFDGRYPFEFTVPLPEEAREFRFRVNAVRVNGTPAGSETGELRRERGAGGRR